MRVNVTEIWMRREIRGVISHGIVVDQAISDQHRDWNGWAHSQRLEAVLAVFTDVSFLLVAVVLEPDFYLSGCQAYHSSQVLSLRCRQVTLLAKSTLQFERLCLGEKHSSLPLLLFRLVVLLRFNVREGQMTRLFFSRICFANFATWWSAQVFCWRSFKTRRVHRAFCSFLLGRKLVFFSFWHIKDVSNWEGPSGRDLHVVASVHGERWKGNDGLARKREKLFLSTVSRQCNYLKKDWDKGRVSARHFANWW